MAIVSATLVYRIDFPGTQNICLWRFTVPSVPAASISDDIEFDMYGKSQIVNIRISNKSTNYNFSLRLQPAVTPPSIEEIYDIINASDTVLDNRVDVYFAKDPEQPDCDKIYGQIKNLDNNLATGVITFEFVFVCF